MSFAQMLKINTSASLVLVLVLGFAPLAWSHAGHDHADEPTISLPDVVAKVNDHDIKKETIWTALTASVKKYKSRGMALSGEQEKIAAKKLIDNQISRRLLLDKVEELKITVSPAQVKEKLKRVSSGFRSHAAFQDRLAKENLTMDQYKSELAEDLKIDAVLEKELGGDVKITDEAIKKYYNDNASSFSSPEQRRASVILIKVKKGASAEEDKKAKDQLEEIIDEIKGGKDFGMMAKQFSQDTLKSRGGDLGFFVQRKMFKPFSDRAFAMKVGDISEIFSTPHGYQVLKLTDKKEAVTRSLEDARGEIRDVLMKKAIKNKTANYIAKLRKQAKVKVYF